MYKNVTELHTDFETALISAAMNIYTSYLEGTDLKLNFYGCFFHFTQALWRKFTKLGLRKKELIRLTKILAKCM